MVSKKDISEQDMRTKYITPAIEKARQVIENLLEKYADKVVENMILEEPKKALG